MSDGHRVNMSEVQSVIDKCTKISETLEDRLAAAKNRVDALHLNWNSEAAQAHREFYDRWSAAAGDMHAALLNLQREARDAHQRYGDAVEMNISMWPAL